MQSQSINCQSIKHLNCIKHEANDVTNHINALNDIHKTKLVKLYFKLLNYEDMSTVAQKIEVFYAWNFRARNNVSLVIVSNKSVHNTQGSLQSPSS